jgi:uncharacterized protein
MTSAKKIILDTNFVLIPAQLNVDIFEEITKTIPGQPGLFILDKSIKELQKIAEEQKGALKRQVKLTLELIQAKNVNIIPTEGDESVDNLLVEYAKQGYTIATQDKELKQRIGTNIIVLRQKKKIELK